MRDVTLAVLAGGEGRRMGRPKSQLLIDGKPILERLLDTLKWDGPTMLVTAPGRESPIGASRFDREVVDRRSAEGPLRGIITALEAADPASSFVVVVPLDMPNLSRDSLEWMLRQLIADRSAALMMLRRGSKIESLPAVFRTRLSIPIVRARLAAGQLSIRAMSEEPAARVQSCPRDWPEAFWMNLNTPDDLVSDARR